MNRDEMNEGRIFSAFLTIKGKYPNMTYMEAYTNAIELVQEYRCAKCEFEKERKANEK